MPGGFHTLEILLTELEGIFRISGQVGPLENLSIGGDHPTDFNLGIPSAEQFPLEPLDFGILEH